MHRLLPLSIFASYKRNIVFKMTHHRIIPLLAVIIGINIFSFQAAAQTCRVSCGKNAEGHQIFKEVYEYDYVSEKPSFPGGDYLLMNFINKTRRYPSKAYKKGIQGRVTCSFVVNTDGSISNIHILKGVEQSLNEEALRIIASMPLWNPGKINGQHVPVRVIRCVPFRR